MTTYDALEIFVTKGNIFKSMEEAEIWCEDWENTRKELIEKFGKRLENIYIAKEVKA